MSVELEISVSIRYPTRIWDACMRTVRGTYAPIGIEARTGKAVLQAIREQYRFAQSICINKAPHGWIVWIKES